MDPKLIYLFACGNTLKDEVSKKFTAIDLFSTVIIPKSLDFWFQGTHIIGNIDNAPAGPVDIDVMIFDPDEKLFSQTRVSGPILPGAVMFAGFFPVLKFEKQGLYHLRAAINGTALRDNGQFYIKVIKES